MRAQDPQDHAEPSSPTDEPAETDAETPLVTLEQLLADLHLATENYGVLLRHPR